jgi:hypothetical protein
LKNRKFKEWTLNNYIQRKIGRLVPLPNRKWAEEQKGKGMLANFIESLKVMGFGMLGIFAVAVVLIVIMKVLTKLFPAKEVEE